ncbi:Chaperonin 60 subunit beta [Melia azedarach]|uniref:Chaperonin 60 subunit beta n=1 Tax=Melia azedarach TaxID=155640 RepID=A0ACC1XII4_MELAZ|nr:Chaperonin 60 subunit beta [Melia azedarach]
MSLFLGLSLQCILDLTVAGISLVIGLGIFAIIASILCSAAFLQNAKILFRESPDGDAILSSTEVSLLNFSVNFSMFAI